MAFFDFFRKKTEEEQFEEAVKKRDYTKIINLGRILLRKHPDSLSIFTPYIDALVKFDRKKEAISEIISFAKRKINEEYYDVAITLLNRALKLDPFNLEAIKLLSETYIRKELLYEAFEVLLNSFKKFVEAGKDPTPIKELLDRFVEKYFHPIFYERYAEALAKAGYKEEAFVNYILAGNLYMNLKRPRSALKVFLKARELKANDVIDKQIIEVISHIKEERPEIIKVLSSLIRKHEKDFDFIEFTVSQFKENNKLSLLRQVINGLKDPLLKYVYLAMIEHELGEEENAEEYLEKVGLINKELYDKLESYMFRKGRVGILSFKTEKPEEIPEPEEILKVFNEILDINSSTLESLESLTKEKESSEDIKAGIELLQKNTDGKRLVSMAEAFLGIGDYKEAEKFARQALKTEERLRAAILTAESLKKQGRDKEALSSLFDVLKENLSPEEKAQIEVEIGEIYRNMGDKERALHWYKSAQEVLKDPDLEEKIKKIEKELG